MVIENLTVVLAAGLGIDRVVGWVEHSKHLIPEFLLGRNVSVEQRFAHLLAKRHLSSLQDRTNGIESASAADLRRKVGVQAGATRLTVGLDPAQPNIFVVACLKARIQIELLQLTRHEGLILKKPDQFRVFEI